MRTVAWGQGREESFWKWTCEHSQREENRGHWILAVLWQGPRMTARDQRKAFWCPWRAGSLPQSGFLYPPEERAICQGPSVGPVYHDSWHQEFFPIYPKTMEASLILVWPSEVALLMATMDFPTNLLRSGFRVRIHSIQINYKFSNLVTAVIAWCQWIRASCF